MHKVIHLTPDFAAEHPYNLQLAKHLRELGVNLQMVREKNFLKSVLKWRPDILHIHWLHSFIQTDEDNASIWSCFLHIISLSYQLSLTALSGTKIVWTVHELAIPETHYPRLDQLCIRLVSFLSQAIITHCHDAKKQVTDIYASAKPNKVKVIPHGNFTGVTENKILRDQSRKLLAIPPSTFVILFFGVIRPYKGVLELIEVYKQLKGQDILLLIVGGTIMHHKECVEYMSTISKSISGNSNIKLVPEFIPNDKIQIYMNASDIVAFPYQSIMTSGALIMAMGFGKPCIAVRRGCMSETLDSSGAFLYDADDESGLSNALVNSLDSREKLSEMGEYNKGKVENMNWQQISKQTLDVYQNCILAKR